MVLFLLEAQFLLRFNNVCHFNYSISSFNLGNFSSLPHNSLINFYYSIFSNSKNFGKIINNIFKI